MRWYEVFTEKKGFSVAITSKLLWFKIYRLVSTKDNGDGTGNIV